MSEHIQGRRRTIGVRPLSLVLMLAVAASTAGLTAQKPPTIETKAASFRLPAKIWRDPGAASTLNLTYGAGGQAHAPDPAGAFTFLKEDSIATSPKFDVIDARGVEWKVKLGQEPQSETAATRFLWAAGYFVDEDYYLAEFTVQGLATLKRGHEYVSAGGVVHGARLERKLAGLTRLETWDWYENPFVGSRELNGLRVMMALLNNWDLKNVNNSILIGDGERRYTVTDAGATFGNTGNYITRTKNTPKDYEDSQFIAKVMPDYLDFVLHSRPFFLGAVAPGNYSERTKMEGITRHIPRADAKWLGLRLAMLTDDQLRDGFRAGGYDAGAVEILARTIRARINALKAL